MTLLLDIAPNIRPERPEATGGEVYRRFLDEPDTLAIAVVDDDGRPVGLIERNAFLVEMAGQYGHALWAKRPLSQLMVTDLLVVDGDMTVSEFCGQQMLERPSALLHGFIVTCGGRYAGVGTAVGLLQASAAETASHAREMSRLAEEAREALAAKGRFLAVMSHEIRTPLNGVLAVAEIVRRKVQQPDLLPLVDTILESGEVLLRLLNDALDLSRAEAAGLELDEEPLAAARLLDDVQRLWSPQAELKTLSLSTRYDGPEDLWVLADAVRLRQVLNNLVGNALKFTALGGVDVSLAASAEGEIAILRGEVADTGSGVPADRLASIFEPFAQTEEGVRRGGAGLGLAVCRQIVERMHGRIEARANPGGGALFVFEVPLYRVLGEAEGSADEADEGLDPLHVLIVDDNATNRMVAQSLCGMFGCTTDLVEDGAQAIDAAELQAYDLILMDIKMPGVDGVEATRRIRAGAGVSSKTPIIALTANADPADAAFYRSCGMNGVVEKPIKAERLLDAMRAVMDLEDVQAQAA